jgi:cysteine desulfurase
VLIYADCNATTPLDPEVQAVMGEAMARVFGNPSSLHTAGQEARRWVERARAQVAALIGAAPDEIVFTSGGTEADNLAVLGAVAAARAGRQAVVTSSIEHHAVLEACAHLRGQGHAVTLVAVDGEGRLDLSALAAAVDDDVALVSLMLANNDTGVVQDVAAAVAVAKAHGALVHSDAVQAAGKLPIDVAQLAVDLLALSSHKLYGPKGMGALFVRRGTRMAALGFGGRQEKRLRPGTENVPAIAGFGKACELARARLAEDNPRTRALRDHFEQRILAEVPGTTVNGRGAVDHRVANTSNISFAGLDGEALVINLDMLGMAVSTGAACSIVDHTPSHVLVAMGRTEAQAKSSLRFSFGRGTTDADIVAGVALVKQAAQLVGGGRA